jgi:hypothetical protein
MLESVLDRQTVRRIYALLINPNLTAEICTCVPNALPKGKLTPDVL